MNTIYTKNILIISSLANSLILFRGDFIKSLINAGYKVYAAAPEMEPEISNELKTIGAYPIEYTLQRTGLNPFKDLATIFQLRKIMKSKRIDLVFPYTIKPVIYGSFAARLSGTAVISLITGLGFTFSASSRKSKLLQSVSEELYKRALKKNKVIIFQNEDDRLLFLNRHILSNNMPTVVVSGSGVHLDKYPYRVNSNTSEKIVFVMVARLIREKGINLYIESAQIIKSLYPQAEFHVIGDPDLSPSAIKLEKLEELNNQGIIVYHGYQKNVSDLLYKSDVFVLPSFYREGVPRSILEALSIGMPIVTTNTPGCCETVINGKNGFLIEPNNQESLTNAIINILKTPRNIKHMGIESRKLAEQKFDVHIINKELNEIIKGALYS